jgi:hypothetical protein
VKIPEIKLQALRIMFADSDVSFTQNEYDTGVLSANPNTRDKLVRMDDSIRRGIDLYYNIIGEETSRLEEKTLYASGGVYYNKLDFSSLPTNFGFPTRIDVKVIDQTDLEAPITIIQRNQINFIYNSQEKFVFFEEDFANYYNEYDYYVVHFTIWYKVARQNLPFTYSEGSYDLDTIKIPQEVQRALPFYIKSELYEEDEFNVAQLARQQYLAVVSGLRKPFNKVQTKIKRARVFNK